MPVPKTLKDKIRRMIDKEYKDLPVKRRIHIRNAIIYHRLGYGRRK